MSKAHPTELPWDQEVDVNFCSIISISDTGPEHVPELQEPLGRFSYQTGVPDPFLSWVVAKGSSLRRQQLCYTCMFLLGCFFQQPEESPGVLGLKLKRCVCEPQ